jgi:hypothetical protein
MHRQQDHALFLNPMNRLNRRKFLGKSGLAATLAPLAVTSMTGPFIRSVRAGEPGPNEKVRLGLIGCGGMGKGDLECFFLNPEVDCVVICDVDEAMSAKGVEICEKKRNKKPETVKDFRRVLDRKDVDVVLIATPDHWHALPTVLACQAGKDVYVEKRCSKRAAVIIGSSRWDRNGAVANTSLKRLILSGRASSAK